MRTPKQIHLSLLYRSTSLLGVVDWKLAVNAGPSTECVCVWPLNSVCLSRWPLISVCVRV